VKMRCSHCNEKLAIHDLWCIKCCKQTELIAKDLSAIKNLNASWKNYKPYEGVNLPVGIWATLTGFLPMLILIWLLNHTLPAIGLWPFLALQTVVWTLFLPVLFVPFHAVCKSDGYKITVRDFFQSFTSYFRYLLFSLISVFFYLAIFLICQGDPILNLVWLVLVLYWVAIVLPVPVIMERYNLNAFQAVKLSYKYLGDLRWNIFLMALILASANVLALLLLIIGLAVVLPFTWFAVRDYVDKLIENEVIEVKAV